MNLAKQVSLFIILAAALFVIMGSVSAVGNIYNDLETWVTSVFSPVSLERVERLEAENQSLRFQIEKLKQNNSEFPPNGFKVAQIYSSYPFNYKNSIVIDLGSEDGVEVGNPVLTEERFAVGVVSQVKNTQSEVRTIFDADWKSSVGIGQNRVQAVLEGGDMPTLNLIPQEAELEAGDYVYNLDSRLPMESLLGTLNNVESGPSDVWQRGSLSTVYNIEDISAVLVDVNFP